MKKRRILVLMHEDLVPPDDLSQVGEKERWTFKTEADVVTSLIEAGHEVEKVGVRYDLDVIVRAIERTKPHLVFNLLEEFRDVPQYDHAVVSYFDLIGMPYTGCAPRGLVLARDKALSKQIMTHHRIRVPGFAVFPRGKRVKRASKLRFPLIVKTLDGEGSVGIAKASLVRTDEKLVERVRFIHESIGTSAIAEEFIEGREIYASVIGNDVLTVFPLRELVMNLPEDEPLIATERAKWDPQYQSRWGVDHAIPELSPALESEIVRSAKRIYRTLKLTGYGRIDFRLDGEGRLYFLEANPNPDLARVEEFSCSARSGGLEYPELLTKIMRLGFRRSARG